MQIYEDPQRVKVSAIKLHRQRMNISQFSVIDLRESISMRAAARPSQIYHLV